MKKIKYVLPSSSPGLEKKIACMVFEAPPVDKKVYIQAGLHADEAPGYLVACRLLELLEQAENEGRIRGIIHIVPMANPIGLGQWENDTVQGRFDRFDNVNFNRDHLDLSTEIAEKIRGKLGADPSQNVALIRKCTSRILQSKRPTGETEFLKHLLLSLSHDADIVLDLHCDHQALLHVYTGCSLWPEARDLSSWLGAEVTLLADDSGGMPFDEANSKLWWDLAARFPEYPIPPACLAATVELRGVTDTTTAHVEKDAHNIFSFLQGRGFIDGETVQMPKLPAEATLLAGVDYVKAEQTGIITFLKEPGAFVRKGESLAEIIDPSMCFGTAQKNFITSKTDGLLFARCLDRFARPGKIIAKVAGEKVLEGKDKNLLTA